MDSLQEYVGKVWSSRYDKKPIGSARLHWSQSKHVISHVTKLICGEAEDTIEKSIASLLKTISPKVPYKKGISVACGKGHKEMGLVENGIVEHFDLYELSEQAIELGRIEAARRGLEDKITFHFGDAFKKEPKHNYYDFVYWDNALHHMLNVDFAVQWSKDLLSERGCFFMFDFVGPSRFQWTDTQMQLVNDILQGLDDVYFLIPDSEYMWKKEAKRSTVEEILRDDPSEAADSDNILPAFKKIFPKGTVIPLGGLVYVLGLDGIIVNIPDNSILLDKLLKIDSLLSKQAHNYFAVAYSFKETDSPEPV